MIQSQSRTIATLRDTLLPKLLSGGVKRARNTINHRFFRMLAQVRNRTKDRQDAIIRIGKTLT